MSADKPAIWHPFTQHGLGIPEIRVARAEGATLYTDDGRAILDAISSWWVNLHGHGHPHIARAVAEQAAKLDQVIFAGFTHEPAERLAAKLLAPRTRRPEARVLFRLRFDGGRGRDQDGGRVLAQSRPSAQGA